MEGVLNTSLNIMDTTQQTNTPSNTGFDFAGAKAAGYSDQQIQSYLSAKQGGSSPQTQANSQLSPIEIARANALATATKQPQSGNFIQNAGADLGNVVKGIFNIPGLAVNAITNPGQTFSNVGQGLVDEYGSLISNPVEHFSQKPFSTILDVLPFLGPAKAALFGKAGEAANVAKAGEAANVAKTGEVANVAQTAAKTGDLGATAAALKEAELRNTIATNANKVDISPSMSKMTTVDQPSFIPGTEGEIGTVGSKLVRTPQGDLVPQVPLNSQAVPKTAVEGSPSPLPTIPNSPEVQAFRANGGGMPTPEQPTNQVAQNVMPKLSPTQDFIANKYGEAVNGGGSKDLIARNVNLDGAITSNEANFRNGINSALTGTDKIQKTQEALTNWGQEINKIYTKSTTPPTDSSTVANTVKSELLQGGFDPKEIQAVYKSITGGGNRALNDSSLWDLKRKLDDSSFNSSNLMNNKRQAFQAAGRVVRNMLDTNVKEARPALRMYQTLLDNMEGLQERPGGLNPGSITNLPGTVVKGAKNVGNYAAQKVFDATGTPKVNTEGVMPPPSSRGLLDRITNPIGTDNFNLIKGIPKAGAKLATTQIGQASRFSQVAQGQPQATADNSIAPVQLKPLSAANTSIPMSYTAQQAQADTYRDPYHASIYQNRLNTAMKQAQSSIAAYKLQPNEKDFMQSAYAMNDTLNQLKQLIPNAGIGPQNNLIGGVREATDPNYSVVSGMLAALRAQTDKVQVGGRVSGYLLKALNNTPKATDTPEVALAKINQLQTQLATKYNSLLPYYGLTVGSESMQPTNTAIQVMPNIGY